MFPTEILKGYTLGQIKNLIKDAVRVAEYGRLELVEDAYVKRYYIECIF